MFLPLTLNIFTKNEKNKNIQIKYKSLLLQTIIKTQYIWKLSLLNINMHGRSGYNCSCGKKADLTHVATEVHLTRAKEN